MRIVVCIKQTFDTEAKITLANGKISEEGVNFIINPYDEFAIEEALRIKERLGGEVVVVTVGQERAQDSLRQALAMGADRALLVTDAALDGGDESTAARALAKAVAGMEYDLILTGHVAVDDGAAQVPARLAELLNLPQVNVVQKLELGEGKAVCHREIEGATEVVEVSLPAVITAQKALNEPRYPSLKGIMSAKKKEMKKVGLAEIGLDAGEVGAAGAKNQVVEYSLPQPRQAGKIIDGEPEAAAREIVRLLREEAKVI